MPTTLRQCACDPRQILVAVISKMAVQAAQDKHESEALAAEARRALADAHALPGMRDDLTEEQRLDPAVRAPTATERADGLCLYALALHRSSTASQEAHEVCARCRATCRPLSPCASIHSLSTRRGEYQLGSRVLGALPRRLPLLDFAVAAYAVAAYCGERPGSTRVTDTTGEAD